MCYGGGKGLLYSLRHLGRRRWCPVARGGVSAEKGLYIFLLKRNATLIKITRPIDLAPAQVLHYCTAVVRPSRDPHPSPSRGAGIVRPEVVVLASRFEILAKIYPDKVSDF